MLNQIIHKPHSLIRMRKCYLGKFFDDFATQLQDSGYSTNTIQCYLSSIEHFSNWLELERILIRSINKDIIQKFLYKHLPICQCTQPNTKTLNTVRAALHKLLPMLPCKRLSQITSTKFHKLVFEFDDYLKNVCGLAEATRLYRRRYAYEFLTDNFNNSSPVDFAKLAPEKIKNFALNKMDKYKNGSASVFLCSLRNYLKFLQYKGVCKPNLIAAIPKIPI